MKHCGPATALCTKQTRPNLTHFTVNIKLSTHNPNLTSFTLNTDHMRSSTQSQFRKFHGQHYSHIMSTQKTSRGLDVWWPHGLWSLGHPQIGSKYSSYHIALMLLTRLRLGYYIKYKIQKVDNWVAKAIFQYPSRHHHNLISAKDTQELNDLFQDLLESSFGIF